MATLNLGRIKPVFRGAYAGGTAYIVDDIVTSGNETFICILASTGNATSNATYWTKLAAKGTDGTDVGATLTTSGDILYRDGSGLQRLAKGSASQTLQMDGSAAFPNWVTVAPAAQEVVQIQYFQTNSRFEQTINGGWEALNDGSTDFVVSITPTSASNKILLHASFGMLLTNNASSNYGGALRWQKKVASGSYGDCTLFGSTSANTLSSSQAHFSQPMYELNYVSGCNHTYLDTPNTTSALQYRLEAYPHGVSGNVWGINRNTQTGNDIGYAATTTTILTATEIAV